MQSGQSGMVPPPYESQDGFKKEAGAGYSQPQGTYYGGGYSGGMGNSYDGGQVNPTPSALSFSEQSVRLGFVRKVYTLLSIQLVITAVIVSVFMFVEPVKVALAGNIWVFFACFIVVIVLVVVLGCCESARRTFPTNIILLGIFTIAEGFMLGTLCGIYDTSAVIMALGITLIVVVALTIFAFISKWDFTPLIGIMFCVLLGFVLFSFLMIFFNSRWLDVVIGSVGALIFSIYIVIDTQMMLGGNHKYAISPEEYIFASLNLYLDVINLFLYILMILGAGRND